MEKLKKNKGITLIALVITIIVLLILAGVSLSMVLNQNGIFSRAEQARIQAELGKIEERGQLIYSDKLLQKANNNEITKVETSEVIDQLRLDGYTIEQRQVSAEDITGISIDKEKIQMGINKTEEIRVTYEGVEDPFVYYVEVEEKYYQMHSNKGFITINRKNSNLTKADFEAESGEEGTDLTLNITSSDETVVTGVLKEGSNNIIEIVSKEKEAEVIITVTYGTLAPAKCTVKVKETVLATALEINSVRARIAKDYTRWLTATAIPADAEQEFEWNSNDPSIAAVDNKGVITAKKSGKTIVTAKTKDGSNLSSECEVTVVENAPNVATLTDYQSDNTVAKDENGNLITVPGDFKVLTGEGTKVTEGIVIQDRDMNEFVWVPVDSVSIGTANPADDIRLGRYTFDKYTSEPKKMQDASEYEKVVDIYKDDRDYYREVTQIDTLNDRIAKNLGKFVQKTQINGGYYFARYEASEGINGKPASKKGVDPWYGCTHQKATVAAKAMYESDFVESDLINSYSWDTAIVFIQKFSGDNTYAKRAFAGNNSPQPVGKYGDEILNIDGMASNVSEWSTEISFNVSLGTTSYFRVRRGTHSSLKGSEGSRDTWRRRTVLRMASPQPITEERWPMVTTQV